MVWDHPQVNQLLEFVRSQTESVARTKGEVLYITQRNYWP